jgi:hypothetical protein
LVFDDHQADGAISICHSVSQAMFLFEYCYGMRIWDAMIQEHSRQVRILPVLGSGIDAP